MDNVLTLDRSGRSEHVLQPVALWSAECADAALVVFEDLQAGDWRPREAINGAREFGLYGRRDKALRTLAWAAHAAARESVSHPAKYAARSAMFAAALAYTHLDLVMGDQGVRQARHLLGSAVYAALASEVAAKREAAFAEKLLNGSANTAPKEVGLILKNFPAQRRGGTRLSQLFCYLDGKLRPSGLNGEH
jgi:hypothetical protein